MIIEFKNKFKKNIDAAKEYFLDSLNGEIEDLTQEEIQEGIDGFGIAELDTESYGYYFIFNIISQIYYQVTDKIIEKIVLPVKFNINNISVDFKSILKSKSRRFRKPIKL